MRNFTIEKVSKAVKELGLEVVSVLQPDYLMDEDGEVHIGKGRHIQVGDSYLMIVEEKDEGFLFSDEITSIAQLKRELTKVA